MTQKQQCIQERLLKTCTALQDSCQFTCSFVMILLPAFHRDGHNFICTSEQL